MLGLVLAAALVLRLAPLLFFEIWGSDTGEYLAITEHLLDTGHLPTSYAGWGLAYPSFPGMEILAAELSILTGLPPLRVIQVVVPILNLLAVLGVYLIARRLWDRRSALWAAAVFAVAMPVVYVGSHGIPESLAQGLAVIVVLLAFDADDAIRWTAAAGIGLAVVVTHHLTSYLLVLALAGLWMGRLLTCRDDPGWSRLGLTAVLGTATLAYWLGYAAPFRERIVATVVPAPVVAAVAVGTLVVLAVVARLRDRIPWTIPLRPGAIRNARIVGVGIVGLSFGLAAAFATLGVVGVSFRMDPGWLPWYVPLIVVLFFVPYGLGRAQTRPSGIGLAVWIVLLVGSIVAGAVLAPHVLIPHRHVPALFLPVALLAGVGVVRMDLPDWRRALPVLVVVGLVATAYPPAEVIGGFQEGITSEEMAAVRWADRNLPRNATVLADHRLSSMLFGVADVSPTWDAGEQAWHATSFEEARPQLARISTPSGPARVDYVLLSPSTERGVALEQWERARPLSDAAKAKFDRSPFQLVYAQEDVRVYRIAWDTVE